MSNSPEVDIQPSPEALAAAVAGRLVIRLAAVQGTGRVPAIALTGGSIADKIHEAVVTATKDAVDWSRVDIWWGDERYVPAGNADRNVGQARKSLLDHVDVSPGRVHEMPASDGPHVTVDDAATAYGDDLRDRGPEEFDVLLLGVGPDGHVASLFPGSAQLNVEDAIAVGVTDSPKPPPERISLTFEALNRSREVWFVVSGADKAAVVAKVLQADDVAVRDLPASGVHGQEETVWFLDEDAASKLSDR